MVRVLYIAGDFRSGSTFISQILGSYDHCLAVGELFDFWAECQSGNRLCSCGSPLRDCAFWTSVLAHGFGDVDSNWIQQVIDLRRKVQSPRHLPFLLFRRIRPRSFDRNLQAYIAILERLYSSIQAISGCEAIVDSSKLAAYALALNESPAIDVELIHVSRDSRACVYSWSRQKKEPSTGEQTRHLDKRPPVSTALMWQFRNLIFVAIAGRFSTSIRIRFEAFARQPNTTMRLLSRHLGLSGHEGIWVGEQEVMVSPSSHVFAGNPDRIQHGAIRVRSSEEWRTAMSLRQQRLVLALTLPAMWLLGHLGSRSTEVGGVELEHALGEQAG